MLMEIFVIEKNVCTINKPCRTVDEISVRPAVVGTVRQTLVFRCRTTVFVAAQLLFYQSFDAFL